MESRSEEAPVGSLRSTTGADRLRRGYRHRAVIHGCIIEDDSLIVMGSVLLNDVRIGTGSVVAAGALVTEGTQVLPGSLVMGVPARVVRPGWMRAAHAHPAHVGALRGASAATPQRRISPLRTRSRFVMLKQWCSNVDATNARALLAPADFPTLRRS